MLSHGNSGCTNAPPLLRYTFSTMPVLIFSSLVLAKTDSRDSSFDIATRVRAGRPRDGLRHGQGISLFSKETDTADHPTAPY